MMVNDNTAGPFDVDPRRASAALQDAWGEQYACFTFADGVWSAHSRHAPHSEQITGDTPDDLARAIRADWLARQSTGIPPQRGPSGMGPS